MEQLASENLPAVLEATRPEGFAYWGLYPEQYVDAARRFFAALRPRRVVVIGARSIGTTLSSVVESALAGNGVSTESLSVRPSGHPFNRSTRFAPAEWDLLRRGDFERFLIVDEGPGMSGSTLGSIATALLEFGIERERIVFFPSYDTSGSSFINEEAKRVWQQQRRFVGVFDPGQLVPGDTVDASAGRWRALFVLPAADRVLVVPHHERRKYLEYSPKGEPVRLHRYCGLGPTGTATHERALVLRDSGLVPNVGPRCDGLMGVDFVPGVPLSSKRQPVELIETMARYLAFRSEALRTSGPAGTLTLSHMLRTNVSLGLGEDFLQQVDMLTENAAASSESSCCVDGRMQPHEWIECATGYMKVDAFDHGDDHFYPGPCDIAWDFAGAAIEFALSSRALAMLIGGYVERTGDSSISRRMPFYLAAYSAFRMGYCALTKGTLPSDVERHQMGVSENHYRTRLQRLLRRPLTLELES
jgi:hypothetical protein